MRKKSVIQRKKVQSIAWITACLLLVLPLAFSSFDALKAKTAQKAMSKLSRLYVPNVNGRSSDQKISINAKEEPLISVLKRVADEVNVGISYQDGLIPDKNITVYIQDTPVFQALKIILKGTGLKAILPFSRDVLVIKKKLKAKKVAQTGSITGTVTNEMVSPYPAPTYCWLK